MLSRNNWKEQVRQQEPKKQRFTIKKLTIGVASVLIGFTFMGMSASANDQNTPGTPAANTNTNANASSTEGQSDNAASQPVSQLGAVQRVMLRHLIQRGKARTLKPRRTTSPNPM